MWLLRPDSRRVWTKPEIRARLPRYYAIMKEEKKARYLITKKINVNYEPDDSLQKLWAVHEEGHEKFIRLLNSIDEGQPLEEIESPQKSYLELKCEIANRILENCHFCERKCHKNRVTGELGFCKVGKDAVISSAFLHYGEESVLVPSGTIFFSGCTFRCVFCQNYGISQFWRSSSGKILDGVVRTAKQTTTICNHLMKEGARNINWVGGDPTPNISHILQVLNHLEINITQLWNSNMYLTKDSMKLLLDVMDFWLPDIKYADNIFARRMSRIKNYWEIITRNVKLAYEKGSGELIVRHLCMPGRIEADTYPILEWCNKEIPKSMVNIMGQYRPLNLVIKRKNKYRDINKRITHNEMSKAHKKADELGILWEPIS
ncbi:MAG: radical SAM protein [Candidatus Hodarchaeota archaeon]